MAQSPTFVDRPATPEALRIAAQTDSSTLALRKATRIGPMPNRAVESLPNVGGLVGSLLGGTKSTPLGVFTASVGGMAGETLRQALSAMLGEWERVPADMQGRLAQVIVEGVKQGGMEGIGRGVVGPILQTGGRVLYRSALKPSVAVRKEYGGEEVTNTLVDAGVPITRTGRGMEQVEAMLGASGRDTAAAIAAAEQSGVRGSTLRAPLLSLDRTRATVADRALRESAERDIATFRDDVLRQNPGVLPLTRLQQMKQAEQDLAIKAYQAELRGATPTLEPSLHEDLARGLKEAIERRIPTIANRNARTQDIIGALKAIIDAEGRIANNNLIGLGDVMSLGTGLGAASVTGRPSTLALGVLQEVLTRPEIASRLGIVMDRVGKPQVTSQALRVLSETMNQIFAENESPQAGASMRELGKMFTEDDVRQLVTRVNPDGTVKSQPLRGK